MKPRFSILTLLAATGYVALVLTSLLNPESLWRYASTAAWLLALIYMIVLATNPLEPRLATFGRTVVACITAYLVLTWLPVSFTPEVRVPNASLQKVDLLPHQAFTRWWVSDLSGMQVLPNPPTASAFALPGTTGVLVDPLYLPETKTIEAIAALNSALILGLLGGVTALCRYRVPERRE